MIQFIGLTNSDGHPVYVNVAHILAFGPWLGDGEHKSYVQYSDDTELLVIESPRQILGLIREASVTCVPH